MTTQNNYNETNEMTSADAENTIGQESSEEMTMEALFAEQDGFRKHINSREIVKVKVIQVDKDYVFVDIGEKKEGLIPLADFKNEKNPPAAGTEVMAVLEKRGGEERHSFLSHAKAMEQVGWELCKKAIEEKARVKGTILETVKGGYIVDVLGVRGFMPLSLSELYPAYKHHLPISAKIRCQIIELVREKNRLIVSRKQVLAEDENVRRDQVLAEVKIGDVLRVVVSKVGKDSLFVRFHGIEGSVRMPNIAWKNPEEALASYRRGQRIRAKLVKLDKTVPVLEFGLKQLYANPADLLRRKFPPRTVAKCKVVEVTDAGIKVTVGSDTDGFIPLSEYAPDFLAKPGDELSAAVLGVNASEFKVNLSIKRYEEVQNRKIVAKYLKEAPPLTLGQLLKPSSDNDA